MNWTLGIDTSSSFMSIGLVNDLGSHVSLTRFVKNAHSEHITTAIKSVQSMVGITASDISHCGVVTGPGSFTGLRIGISFIKGLFASGETLVMPLSTLETVAFSWPLDGIISVVFDARQDSVFGATFVKKDGSISRQSEDEKLVCSQFINQTEQSSVVIYDTAGNQNSPLINSLANRSATLLESANLSTGLAAARLAQIRCNSDHWCEAVDIFPNYMQESYAERMKKA